MALLGFFISISTVDSMYNLLMTGFELQISGFRSNRSSTALQIFNLGPD